MKRIGNLTVKIADYNNLYEAFYKAAKSKRNKVEVLAYEKNITLNIDALQKQILLGKVNVGDYQYFRVYDPKERVICAASFPERVLHHAIMNVCHPYFERHLICHTYATRVGKGTYAAIDEAKKSVKKYNVVAKLDVSKYFDNISHQILKQRLNHLFKDPVLLSILNQIIDSYVVGEAKGVPIGNLTSQYFANYYLSSADHYAKEVLKSPSYVRYMDDILIFENDSHVLKEKVKLFRTYVSENLNLIFKDSVMKKCEMGIPFLGYKILPFKLKLNKRSRSRFISKIKEYNQYVETGKWTQEEYQSHVLPLLAFVQKADSKKMRRYYI